MDNLRARVFRNDDQSITISFFKSGQIDFCDITLNPSLVVGFCHEKGVGQDFEAVTDGPILLDEAVEYIETCFDIERPNVRKER